MAHSISFPVVAIADKQVFHVIWCETHALVLNLDRQFTCIRMPENLDKVLVVTLREVWSGLTICAEIRQLCRTICLYTV